MNSAQTGSFVVVATATLAIAALVLVGVPRLARLLFRSRIEEIRDDTVDAILDGRLRHEPSVDMFINTIGLAARRAPLTTLSYNLAMAWAYRDLGILYPAERPLFTFGRLNSAEREVMHELEIRLIEAHQSYTIWGSLLGWIVAPVIVFDRRSGPDGKHDDAQDSVAREVYRACCIDAVPAAVIGGQRPTRAMGRQSGKSAH